VLVLITLLIFPAYAQEQSEQQIVLTDKGTLEISLSTIPINPDLGEQTKFKINFINKSTKVVQEHIDYSVTISKGQNQIFGIPLTHTAIGSVTIPYEFQEAGEYQVSINVQGILFQPIPSESAVFAISVGKNNMNANPKSGCLIATASFGSELAPQVQQLRETRDNVLLKTQSGATFMTGFNSVYYSFSPTIADWERQNPIFKEVVKIAITPLLSSLSILNYVDIDSETEMLGYGIGVILLNIGMYFIAPAFAIIRLRH